MAGKRELAVGFSEPQRTQRTPNFGFIKRDGDNIFSATELPEFQKVTLKVLRWEERDKRLVINDAELVA